MADVWTMQLSQNRMKTSVTFTRPQSHGMAAGTKPVCPVCRHRHGCGLLHLWLPDQKHGPQGPGHRVRCCDGMSASWASHWSVASWWLVLRANHSRVTIVKPDTGRVSPWRSCLTTALWWQITNILGILDWNWSKYSFTLCSRTSV